MSSQPARNRNRPCFSNRAGYGQRVNGRQAYLHEGSQRLRPSFVRRQARQRAAAYIEVLLSTTQRKNARQPAEANGDAAPYGFQPLLGRALWRADHLRDALCAYVVAHLGGPDAVLGVDETGFMKKGGHSVGVARRYSGTAGKVDNCQVGVFAAYAGRPGWTLLDRALYPPASWSKDAGPAAGGHRPGVRVCRQARVGQGDACARLCLGCAGVVGGGRRRLRRCTSLASGVGRGRKRRTSWRCRAKRTVWLQAGRQVSVKSVLEGLDAAA